MKHNQILLLPSCSCQHEINEILAEKGAVIETARFHGVESGPMIKVITCVDGVKRRTKLPTVFARYCPFCGKKYKERVAWQITDTSKLTKQ